MDEAKDDLPPATAPAPVSGEKRAATTRAFAKADDVFSFGPSFFLKDLGRFLKEHYKRSGGKQARVFLRLGDGATLEVCSIIGVAPRWVVVAVDQDAGPKEQIAVEFVPYDLIRRVELSTRPTETSSIGFSQTRAPEVISPETAIGVPLIEPVPELATPVKRSE
jgi:hypothetical protein